MLIYFRIEYLLFLPWTPANYKQENDHQKHLKKVHYKLLNNCKSLKGNNTLIYGVIYFIVRVL